MCLFETRSDELIKHEPVVDHGTLAGIATVKLPNGKRLPLIERLTWYHARQSRQLV
jgi:hypothetical protein